MLRRFALVSGFLLIGLNSAARSEDFATAVKAALEKGQAAQQFAVSGSDANWRFLTNELKHLTIGDLATQDLAKANVEGTDPVAAIAKYNEELKALGVDLLVVPVPPKAAIYPEKLSAGVDAATVPPMTPFLDKLASQGVAVLDLDAAFRKAKTEAPDKQLYCATDSHWSPHGAALAAQIVADRYKDRKDLIEFQLRDLIDLPEQTLEFHGDLLTDAEKASMPKEKLPMARAGMANNTGTDITPVESDPQAPVLVIGDSHCQIFRKGGNMLATGGGFIDHLIVDLSVPVEEVSTQASGGGDRASRLRGGP